MNHEDAASSVCAEAIGKDPSATGTLVDALRDIGRPVDASRLLESAGSLMAGRAVEVIAGLRAAGQSSAPWPARRGRPAFLAATAERTVSDVGAVL